MSEQADPAAPDLFTAAAHGIVSVVAATQTHTELDELFLSRIRPLGFGSAGYLRVFGEGQFHVARYLFGSTVAGWAEKYQRVRHWFKDPVITAVCRTTGSFTLEEVAAPSADGAPILADSRRHGLIDGVCAPVRFGHDELGFVLLGAGHLVHLADHERFLIQGMCETYARRGLELASLPPAPALTPRENDCLRWVAAGRSDPQIGMILGLSANTVHGHVEAAKTKLQVNSRAQLVLRAVMAGLIRFEPF